MLQLIQSMRSSRIVSASLAALLVLALSLVVEPRAALAAGTVGTGTPASCDEAALDAALAGGGSVDFDCGGAPHTITITATKDITADTTIDGGSLITISGGDNVRIMTVGSGVSLTLDDIILVDGRSPLDTFNGEFGNGGAIRNAGTLTLMDTIISSSVASSAGCPSGCTGEGGGIFNSGTLIVTTSEISDNSASTGGGIFNRGTLTLTDSVVNDNRGNSSGGGIYNDNGTVSLIRTLVDDNSAFSSAGGILNLGASLSVVDSTISNNSVDIFDGGGIHNLVGTVLISGSTISGNSVPQNGGGMYNSVSDSDSVTIVDSTFSGNSAGSGGGIFSGMNLTITNSTFSGNSAGTGGGIYQFRQSGIANPPPSDTTLTHVTITNNTASNGAGVYRSSGYMALTGTIIAGNNGSDCGQGSLFPHYEIDSLGHNLADDGGCPFDQSTDLVNASANLGSLADNGGDTLTHLPLGGSDAYNAGAADCGLTEDQRGVSRPQRAACDIGAVEVVNAAPSISSVTAGSPSVIEGGTSTISVVASDPVDEDNDSLSYSFDCDSDGLYEAGPQPGSSLVCSFPDDSGPGQSTAFVINVLVSDPYGESQTGTAGVTVLNQAPALASPSGATIDENQSATVSSTISDPGSLDTFALEVDWGDGTTNEIYNYAAGTTSFSESHQYLDGSADYTVTLTITDKDGGADTETVTVTVNNVAPAVVLGTDVTLNEGDPFSAAGSFNDPGTLDAHTATVDYGDTSGQQPLALNLDGSFALSHDYLADDGQYTVEVCVTDAEGEGCDQLEVTIQNLPPTIDDVVTTVGASDISLDVIASDPAGTNDPLSYEFDCDGDGFYDLGPQANASASCPVNPANLTLHIGVRVSDGDGGEDKQIVTLALSQTYCANVYTGRLSLPRQGACVGTSEPVVVSVDAMTTFCVPLHTGALYYVPSGCPADWHTYIVPGAEPIDACYHLFTGNLRVTMSGGCVAYEVHHYIPAL